MSRCLRRRLPKGATSTVAALAIVFASSWLAPRTLASGRGAAAPVAARACDAKVKPAKLNFTLKDLAGQKVALADLKGKVIILDFWATWCIPCRTEIPGFVALQAKYADRGLQIVGVSVDDPPDKLKPYVAQMQMNYPVLQGKDHGDLLDAFGPIPSIPVSVVIGRDGSICTKHIGIAPMETFEQELEGLL